MAQGDFLRLVCNDPNMRALILKETGKVVYDVRYKAPNWAEYRDKNGIVVASAKEEPWPYSFPYVQIYGGPLGMKIGRAEISTYILNGTPNGTVEFITSNGTVGKSYYNSETLKKFHPEYTSGGGGGKGQKTPPPKDPPPDKPPERDPPGGGGGAGPGGCASLVIGILLFLLIGWLGSVLVGPLTNAYVHAFQILNVVQFITIKIPWLIVLVACLLFVRLPRGLGAGMTVYYVFLLLFTAAAMVFVGIAIKELMNSFQDMRRLIYEIAFNLIYSVPLLVYALVLRFICWVTRKNRNHNSILQITTRAVRVMCILVIVLIMIARITAAYVWRYDMSQDGAMLMILRLVWYFVLTIMCVFFPMLIMGFSE